MELSSFVCEKFGAVFRYIYAGMIIVLQEAGVHESATWCALQANRRAQVLPLHMWSSYVRCSHALLGVSLFVEFRWFSSCLM